ncbi:hypothetical protein [Chryseobacterium kwangjuense]|uniref:Uncharacterized protein n=1 Tax=Chryseobacterium kwangjuense TaxID=267125 RepID=A0A135WIN8_9FLAO|nr:hypothetical protein [Chryseobacterium kwangjuense]KXH84777.1 hypothetical protein AU378_03190 [Chryseobacterium kwangjuense]
MFKKYTARVYDKLIALISENQKEIGRIVEISKFFSSKHYIIFNSRSYDIRNVGFLKNDAELFNSKGVIYFTDLGKERIIKSGEEVRIYHFKLDKTNRLSEKGKLLMEIGIDKNRHKDSIYYVEADDSVDDLLILFFLYYSTQEFNSIGGDGD